MNFSDVDPNVWIILLGGVVVLVILALLAMRMRVLRDDERTLRMHRVERGVAQDPLPNPPWYTGPPSFTTTPRPTLAQQPPQGILYQPPLPPALNQQAVTPPHGIYTNMVAAPSAQAAEHPTDTASGVAPAERGETGPTVVVLADDQPPTTLKNPPSAMESQADTQPYFVPGQTDYASYQYDSLFPPAEPGEEHSLDDALGDDMMNNKPHA